MICCYLKLHPVFQSLDIFQPNLYVISKVQNIHLWQNRHFCLVNLNICRLSSTHEYWLHINSTLAFGTSLNLIYYLTQAFQSPHETFQLNPYVINIKQNIHPLQIRHFYWVQICIYKWSSVLYYLHHITSTLTIDIF